jgi:aldose 1-epimerase
MAVSDFGATLVSLLVPDGKGNLVDVVLGYDEPQGYEGPSGTFFGSTVGRNANRIANGHFVLNGVEYQLDINNGPNNLHSGLDFQSFRVWQVKSAGENTITFSIHSPDGDQGYPGALDLDVTYTLTDDNAVRIDYYGIPQADTIVNYTNHSYFNLNGHASGPILKHTVWMDADFYTPTAADSVPTGEIAPVEGTPMDFRKPKAIGRDIGADYEPLHLQAGYDHNFEVWCNPCAILSDPGSGRTMAVHTDCPGIQLYAGNYLDDQGKDGVYSCRRSGVALETQFYPDSVNHPEWPQPFVKAGQRYQSTTKYQVSW